MKNHGGIGVVDGCGFAGMMGSGWVGGSWILMVLFWIFALALAGFVFGLLFWLAYRLIMNTAPLEKAPRAKR